MPSTHPKTHDGPAAAAERGARRPRARPPVPASASASASALADRGEPARAAGPASRRAPDLAGEAVIRLHAYRLWEQRGRHDGHAIDDWLQAEAELVHLGGQPAPRLGRPGTKDAR